MKTKISQYCRNQSNRYGFCADPDLSIWENLKRHVGEMTILQYFVQAINVQCHNMCDPSSLMPLGVKSLLLGLGLKYCVRTPRPTNKIKITIDCLKRNLRLMWYFKYHSPGEVDEDGPSYIPGLYISNKDLDPPECDDLALEKGIMKFKADLQKT